VPLLIALAIAAGLTPAMAWAGRRVGLVDRPGELKIHGSEVPVTGGAAVAVALLASLAIAGEWDPWLAAAVAVAFLGGLVDDVRPSPPWFRVVVQAAAGSLLVAGGLRLEPFGELGGPMLVLATVACCNAVNMVDGQDGLAGGLGVIAALGLAGVLTRIGLSAALPLALAGALAGFLVWNRPPARVFLGDGGAYAVGVALAAAAGLTTFEGWHGLLATGACLGVLAYELVATIARRLARSAPAVRGDRDHTYDRMAERIGSRGTSTLVMLGLGVLCAVIGVAVVRLDPVAVLAIVVAITAGAALLDTRLLPVPIPEGDR
jgi:UDP-GlcNAc:undecaprenyl-phosphate GlcNAc-1-phosphate transferase